MLGFEPNFTYSTLPFHTPTKSKSKIEIIVLEISGAMRIYFTVLMEIGATIARTCSHSSFANTCQCLPYLFDFEFVLVLV